MSGIVRSLLNKTSVLWELYPSDVVPVVGYTKGFKGKGWTDGSSIAKVGKSDGGHASGQRRHGGYVSGVSDGAATIFCAGNSAAQGSRDDDAALAVKWETWNIPDVSRCEDAASAQKLAYGDAKTVFNMGNSALGAECSRPVGVFRNGGKPHGIPAQTDAACCLRG